MRLIIIFTILLFKTCLPQEYIWPTSATKLINSIFGDYRPGRFHAAIDIKTWNRTGYKTFAIDDGYIFRVKVTPFGSGKSLYLKLKDGKYAIYFHLEKFEGKLQQYVEREQQKFGKYSVDLFFNKSQFPVKKGDVIAYTGRTGAGPPHLHFEMRDDQNQPINPLKNGFSIVDKVAPLATKISITPLDFNSQIIGDFEPKIFDLIDKGKNNFIPKDTVQFFGNVGFSIATYDKASGTNKFGIYSIEFFIDDSLIFSSTYDYFNYEDARQADLDRDYRQMKMHNGSFYKLYKDMGNNLPFYKGEGIVGKNLKNGFHNFKINIYDVNENKSIVKGAFIYTEKQKLNSNVDSVKKSSLEFVVSIDTIWKSIKIFHKKNLDDKFSIVLPDSFFINDNKKVCTCKFKKEPILIKISGIDKYGVESYPDYYNFSNQIPSPCINLKQTFYDDYVYVSITSDSIIAREPKVIFKTDNILKKIEMIRIGENSFIGKYQIHNTVLNFSENWYKLYVECNGHEHSIDFFGKTIQPKNNSSMKFDSDNFSINFSEKSVYRPLFISVQRIEAISSKRIKFASPIYEFNPFDVPLAKDLQVNLKYNSGVIDSTKIAIYSKSQKGWDFLDNILNAKEKTISAKIKNLDQIALIVDKEPPAITSIKPKNKTKIQNKFPRIFAHVIDHISGIQTEEYIEVYLDGKKLIVEYDPELNIIFYDLKKPLSVGEHEIFVKARDNCGNFFEKKSIFTVVE